MDGYNHIDERAIPMKAKSLQEKPAILSVLLRITATSTSMTGKTKWFPAANLEN